MGQKWNMRKKLNKNGEEAAVTDKLLFTKDDYRGGSLYGKIIQEEDLSNILNITEDDKNNYWLPDKKDKKGTLEYELKRTNSYRNYDKNFKISEKNIRHRQKQFEDAEEYINDNLDAVIKEIKDRKKNRKFVIDHLIDINDIKKIVIEDYLPELELQDRKVFNNGTTKIPQNRTDNYINDRGPIVDKTNESVDFSGSEIKREKKDILRQCFQKVEMVIQ